MSINTENDDVEVSTTAKFTKAMEDRLSFVARIRESGGLMSAYPQYENILRKIWLFAVSFALSGVQFSYSIQFALGTPVFNDAFKMPPSQATIILALCGPVSGFVIQPIMGAYSDILSWRFGRRRVFILFGAIGCSLGMLLIALSARLGYLLGDQQFSPDEFDHKFGIVFAITGFIFMNIFVNVIQGPARALVFDVAKAFVSKKKPSDDASDAEKAEYDEYENSVVHEANGMISSVMGLSNCIANVMGGLLLGMSNFYEILFIIGAVFLLISAVPTLIFGREKRFVPVEKNNILKATYMPFWSMIKGIVTFPFVLYPAFLVYFLSWAAYAPLMIYTTQYFGVNIMGGSTTGTTQQENAYHEGMRYAMFGIAGFALVQTFWGFFFEQFQNMTSVSANYFLTQLIATVSYAGLFMLDSLADVSNTLRIGVAFILLIIVALNFGTFNAVPFSLIQNYVEESKTGMYTGVLNAASVIAQSVVNLVFCSIMLNSSVGHQDVKFGIICGLPFSIIASLLSLVLKDIKRDDSEEEKGLTEDYDGQGRDIGYQSL